MDTSALISLGRDYPRSVFPGVWESFEALVKQDRVISSRVVLDEISRQDDDIHEWCKNNKGMFKKDTDEIKKSAMDIVRKHSKLLHANKNRDEADPYLIALASSRINSNITGDKWMIVTQERDRPNKIPSVAKEYGIESIGIVEVFSREGWTFYNRPYA